MHGVSQGWRGDGLPSLLKKKKRGEGREREHTHAQKMVSMRNHGGDYWTTLGMELVPLNCTLSDG